jgi:hypothetical protein
MLKRPLRWIPLLASLLPAFASGQVIQGRVLEAATGNPVPYVEVRVEGSDRPIGAVVTDSTGRFMLRATIGGVYRLRTYHVGFAPIEADVEVGTGAMVELVLRLSPQPTELPAIEVVSRGRAPDAFLERGGFYERRSAGFGVFRTPEEVERRNLFAPSDLFQGISGVRLNYVGIQGKDIRMTRGDDPNCSPRIFIDNVMARRGGRSASQADPPLDALVPPRDILAVEVYRGPSEVPVEFAGNDVTCGVVIIWTKRGSGPS